MIITPREIVASPKGGENNKKNQNQNRNVVLSSAKTTTIEIEKLDKSNIISPEYALRQEIKDYLGLDEVREHFGRPKYRANPEAITLSLCNTFKQDDDTIEELALYSICLEVACEFTYQPLND